MDEKTDEPLEASFNDLAERLAAAAISHHIGNRSVDYTLKQDIRARGRVIGEYWQNLARKVRADMLASRESLLGGSGLKPPAV